MIRWNLFFEVEKIEQLALIDRLATHHDRPPSLKASRKRNHDSSISTRPFSTGSTRCGHVPRSNWLARARRCGRNGGEIDAAERHNPSQRMEPSERLAQQQDAERCTKDR